MTSRKKIVSPPEQDDTPPPGTVDISVRLLKWVGGIAAALLSIGAVFYYIGNWVDSRYMMATIADQREAKHSAEFKALSDKYDSQLLSLVKDAQRGRAWLTYSVSDLKVLVLEGRADDCKARKNADCAKQEMAHQRAVQESDNMKKSAVETSR